MRTPELKLAASREWKRLNSDRVKAYRHAYWLENSEKEAEQAARWRRDNRAQLRELHKRWRMSKRGKATRKRWIDSNREHVRKYTRRRRSEDPSFCMASRLRGLLRHHLRKNSMRKSSKMGQLLGCTLNEFKQHIESLFQDGMSWQKMREIEIDHIRPCVSFDLTKLSEQRLCFHYSNMRPLWRSDNRRKSSQWNGIVIRSNNKHSNKGE